MASNSSPTHEGRKRKKKSDSNIKCKDKQSEDLEVQVAIEELTATGHIALKRGDCEKALICFKKAFKASIELKETRVQRACAFNLGAAYVEAGKPDKGLEFLKRAQPGERGERVADFQFNLAVAHEALGNHSKAVGHYLQASQLYRSQGDGAGEGDTCMKMSHCHLLLKDWTQAAQSLQRAGDSYRVAGKLDSAALALKAAGGHMLQSHDFTVDDIITVLTDCLELSNHIKDPESLGNLYNDLGLSFSQLKLFQEAASCYEQALPLVSTKPSRQAVVLQNLGAVHNTLNQYRQSLDYHRKAAGLHGSLGSRRAQGRCFSNLAFALSQLGEHEEAAENYLHALQAFKDTEDYNGQVQACEGMGETRFKLRDMEKAILYYKQALGLLSKCKDSSTLVQERLINKLSESLQHRLSLTTPGRPQRGVGHVRHTQPGIHPRALRRGDPNERNAKTEPQVSGVGSAELPTRGQDKEEAPGPDGEQAQAQSMGEAAESQPPTMGPFKVQPGANRNLNNTYELPEPHYQNQDMQQHPGLTQQSEHLYESVKLRATQTRSESPLTESSEVLPTSASDTEETTPLLKKWKSQVCLVM
ncbi:hypothetical protein UPYG_G00149780 [Umbra pygmaea]|uniref:Tetratricopeptide repeat protein 24 n=1 Tax=Umbra pygmaea TaxID=75934 RepID=A0ABD0WXY8_UMBPY